MEFATLLWLCTIALSTLGSGVWYDKVRPLLKATFWSWLVRMNVAGALIGLVVKEHPAHPGSGFQSRNPTPPCPYSFLHAPNAALGTRAVPRRRLGDVA